MSRAIFIFAMVVLLGATPATPCTIFKATQSGQTLVGNSEDWVDARAKVWFLRAAPGTHGRVLFGFENGWAQGGMNDQGLFFDGIAGEIQDWAPASFREDFPGNLCEMILEEGATVGDAIARFKQYNFPSLVVGTYVFVDATGNTAVISYSEGRLEIETPDTPSYAIGYRGERARDLLRDGTVASVDAMAHILKACRRRGAYPTQYANVYDPENLEVHVYPVRGAVQPVSFNLKDELAKGDHYYDLASLSEQMATGLLVDHKTQPTLACPPSSLGEYVGEYDIGSLSLTIDRSGECLLLRSEIVLDAVITFEIHPAASDEFWARHLAVEVRFHRDRSARIDGLSLVYDGKVYKGLISP